eukprot:5766878-Amphidinium_carterae.1
MDSLVRARRILLRDQPPPPELDDECRLRSAGALGAVHLSCQLGSSKHMVWNSLLWQVSRAPAGYRSNGADALCAHRCAVPKSTNANCKRGRAIGVGVAVCGDTTLPNDD